MKPLGSICQQEGTRAESPVRAKNENVSLCPCVCELETCPELSDRKVIT